MNWSDLSMSQRSELMQIYLKNGITSLDEMKKHYNSFAEGGFTSPDHDPNNPYHYHVNGQKIVVTPEDWEKYKNDPTFREVRAAVEAEQAAYPEPEYDEVENPAWRKAYQNLVNGVNLRGRDNVSQPLPQGYTRDTKGVVIDASGNYYIPREQASNVPYFINQERGMYGNTVPVRYEQQQMPERTIRQLRQPLPVDRTLDVSNARNKAIRTYMQPQFRYRLNLPSMGGTNINFDYHKGNGVYTSLIPKGLEKYANTGVTLKSGETISDRFSDIYRNLGLSPSGYGTKEQMEALKPRFAKLGYDTNYNASGINLFEEQYIGPSRQEAEKKAVISIGDLERVGTFAEGGKLDIPPYWGQPTNKKDSPIDYLSRYVNSQAFARRAPNQSYIKRAKNAVNNFNGVTNSQWREYSIGPHINEYNNTITMYPGRIDTPYAPYEYSFKAPYMTILAHEYGHIIDPNYGNENNVPKSYTDLYKTIIPKADSHDSRPDEIYADLQSLRYQLYENNIFDIINDGAFNESHLDKALKQGVPNRLLYTMPKEAIIQMMNTIADSGSQDDAVNMVANGGPLMVLPLWQ